MTSFISSRIWMRSLALCVAIVVLPRFATIAAAQVGAALRLRQKGETGVGLLFAVDRRSKVADLTRCAGGSFDATVYPMALVASNTRFI